MGAVITNEFGNIVYSEEFLANLAGIVTMECYGIVGMASQKAMDGIVQLFKGENLSKGVKVQANEQEVKIQLFVAVKYGVSLSAVAETIRSTVKYKVSKLTGLNISKVDVTISDIRL